MGKPASKKTRTRPPSGVFTAAPVIPDENGCPASRRRAGMGRKKGPARSGATAASTRRSGCSRPRRRAHRGGQPPRTSSARSSALRYVRIDTDKAKQGTDVSGRALELLYKPQVDYGNRIREDSGEHGLQAVLSMLLRVAMRAKRTPRVPSYIDGPRGLVGTPAGSSAKW